MLNQEIYLKRYQEDEHLSIDYLAVEQALKILPYAGAIGCLQKASAGHRPVRQYTALQKQRS